MLIEKRNPVAIHDVVSIKLTSGDEIVGKLIDQSSEAIWLAKPVTVVLQPVNQKQMGLSFLPVLGSVDPETSLQIPTAALAVCPVKTGKAVTANYIQMTSGLITPGASLV